ncbi:MAG: M23 family metallopeptidase [Clostridia bacterium]|nr:M23 family metallopeptidase [Clostridia bacterium]
MWEKFKNSKFATKMRNAKSSRAVYITVVTLLLALAVLITATAIANRVKKNGATTNENPPDNVQNGNGSEGNGNTDNPGNTPPPSGDSSEQTPGDEDSSGGDAGNSTQTSTVPELSLPVNGIISKGHDTTVQVFSPTTGDYRIHLGLDMVTGEDSPVLAAADGVVSRIWDDALMGKCLAISHSGDCYTIYKNLDTVLPDDIVVGASVTVGQQIGTVGDTATLELAEEPHLHMEMTVKGLAVDPREYFSQQALAALGKDESHEQNQTE